MNIRSLCCAWFALSLAVLPWCEASARDRDREDLATAGLILVGVTTVLPHTACIAQRIGGGPGTAEDRLFMAWLCTPMVGLAVAGISLMEDHPLTVLCGLFMCLMSGVQTAGYCMLITAGLQASRYAQREAPRGPPVALAISPGGIGISGRF